MNSFKSVLAWLLVALLMLGLPTLGLIIGAYVSASLLSFMIGGISGLFLGLVIGLLLIRFMGLTEGVES